MYPYQTSDRYPAPPPPPQMVPPYPATPYPQGSPYPQAFPPAMYSNPQLPIYRQPLLEESNTTLQIPSEIQGPLTLKVKKVDHFFSKWTKKWKYQDSGSKVIPELRPLATDGKDDPWKPYSFVVVRELPENGRPPYFRITIKSPYLLKACMEVVGEVPGLSWNSIPMEVDPVILLAKLPAFRTYQAKLSAKSKLATDEEKNLAATVKVLIDYLQEDYKATLAKIKTLTSHDEITFNLLWAIFVSDEIIVKRNSQTGDWQAYKLVSGTFGPMPGRLLPAFILTLESIDIGSGNTFVKTTIVENMPLFTGVAKITSLAAYPLRFHPKQQGLKETLLSRGTKWAALAGGIHHVYYKGSAKAPSGGTEYNVDSRVMIDKGNFSQRKRSRRDQGCGCYGEPTDGWGGQPAHENRETLTELTGDDFLITSPILYGFSLSDKVWLKFDIDKISDIVWDEDAFVNLVIPQGRKVLLQSLVEANNTGTVFDDFIKGKGQGLVINLFGPPGVGKTFTAEATSEHVKKPLYIVGSSDLGTTADDLDYNLQQVFELAAAWKAIVLIDEADVFLGERNMQDLERNAMVAVFLRHLEYYPAILFLTTNRVKAIDHAFLSRIHIALHFRDLSEDALRAIWAAFLVKAGVSMGCNPTVSDDQMDSLAKRKINGRQVKNAVKTATSLALSRGESIHYEHLVQVLGMMEDFEVEYQNMVAGIE
ncbi:hypothetical protein M422DRAFT_41879 [Sphaerobolus stellatus SS14]|nr:hypothetical protein M422DRAFT_41879 [Sphaerobolus stellatus SS14]